MKFRQAVSILAVLVFLAGLHLYIYAKNISLKYKATDNKVKLSEIKNQNRELKCKLSAIENLAVTEKLAKEKLKMHYPEEINYIVVPKPGQAPVPSREAASRELLP